MIALAVITDGRGDYLAQTIESAQALLTGPFDVKYIVNDCENPEYAKWLDKVYPMYERIHHGDRRGLAGAVHSAWTHAADIGTDYLFHLEEDMVITRKTNVLKMAQLLHCEPYLAQLVLKRQPWSDEEKAAGGQIEVAPDDYTDHQCVNGSFVQHRRLFSFNPCLITAQAISDALAAAPNFLEAGVTEALVPLGYSFAYYGKRESEPRVEHIGHLRSAGYRW